MLELLGFMFEKAVVNLIPIILGALFGAFFVGHKAISSQVIRTVMYVFAGVIAGLWSYAKYDIPERTIEFMEAFYLSIGMSILAAIFVVPAVLLASFRRRNSESSSND